MQPKLKEDPREWLKFTAVMVVATAVLALLLNRRHIIGRQTLEFIGIGLALLLTTCSVRPQWFRWFYRGGMTASFQVGQVMGRVLLTLFFILALTPLGWLLRLGGKDLLQLKRDPAARTYWRPAKTGSHLDRQF